MKDTIRIIQFALIGLVLTLTGYPFNTPVFWLVIVIMVLQTIKENV